MPRDTRTYITVHDGMPEHPKMEVLSDAAFRAIIDLWCWCSRNRTDGKIPAAVWTKRVPVKARKELLGVLIHETPDGFQAHDYLEHQRSSEEIDQLSAKRSEAGKRGGKAKARNQAEGVASATANAKQDAGKNVADTDTESTNKVSTSPGSLTAPVMCELLADLIEGNGSLRPTITKEWLDEARRMIDLDKRDPSKAENLIRWSQEDSFWRKNILSMPKFRKQYDKIRLAALEAWEKNKTGPSPDGELNPDAILGRDLWQLPAPPADLPPEQYREWAKQQRDQHDQQRLEEARRRAA
jgi:hypothetical protein